MVHFELLLMSSSVKKAEDLLPLVQELSHEEWVRLTKLVLRSPSQSDVEAYRKQPPRNSEFSDVDDPLKWEGEGWEEFYAQG